MRKADHFVLDLLWRRFHIRYYIPIFYFNDFRKTFLLGSTCFDFSVHISVYESQHILRSISSLTSENDIHLYQTDISPIVNYSPSVLVTWFLDFKSRFFI